MSNPPRVLVSYSHDSPEHKQRVLELAERLRADGVDATIDQYIETTGPTEGWPRWMDEQIRTSDFVVLVCTETYRKRVEGREEPGRGHGALWEGSLVYQYIYNAGTKNERFVPVLLGAANDQDIPMPLQGVANYRPDTKEGYEALYRRLTGQATVEKGKLGSLKPLASRKIELGDLPSGPPAVVDDSTAAVVDTLPKRRNGPIIAIALVVIIAALSAGGWWVLHNNPSVYRVHVSVLDPQGRAVKDAEVSSSVGGQILHSGEGYQIEIPASSRPADGAVVIRAAAPSAFWKGETEVRLSNSASLTAVVAMKSDKSAQVRGMVVDSSQRAMAGVRVSVVGQTESVMTNEAGAFTLPAHAADGQQVQIRAEKSGMAPVTQWHPAGDAPATIVIE